MRTIAIPQLYCGASGKKIDDFSVRRRIESATAEFFEEYL